MRESRGYMAATQQEKGEDNMKKIPTIFKRGDDFKVINEITPGCEWVFNGEGVATEKLDGTNVQITIKDGSAIKLEKRRNPTKEEKARGEVDGSYVLVTDDPGDKYIRDAINNTDFATWPDGEHSAEAIGPKIQGNPLKLERHILVRHADAPIYSGVQSHMLGAIDKFDYLKNMIRVSSLYSQTAWIEGFVFRHPDGRMAKIKVKDFRYRDKS